MRKSMVKQWTVAEAKSRFSEVISRAREEGPQTITKNGKDAVMVVAVEEWNRREVRKGTLADFFRTSPLVGSNIRIERDKTPPRDVEL